MPHRDETDGLNPRPGSPGRRRYRIIAGSASLIVGLDSVIEVAPGAALLWRLQVCKSCIFPSCGAKGVQKMKPLTSPAAIPMERRRRTARLARKALGAGFILGNKLAEPLKTGKAQGLDARD